MSPNNAIEPTRAYTSALLRAAVARAAHFWRWASSIMTFRIFELGIVLFLLALKNNAVADDESWLRMHRIEPTTAASLSRDSEIVAIVEYNIADYAEGNRYYLFPVFSKTDGTTFNALDYFEQTYSVPDKHGAAEIRYPIFREWSREELVRPIEVFYQLVRVVESDGHIVRADMLATVRAYAETPPNQAVEWSPERALWRFANYTLAGATHFWR